MCIKNIYHNVYVDGDKDVTERVDACRSGHICSEPIVREFDRRINCTRLQLSTSPGRTDSPSSSLKDRQPTPYYFDHRSPPNFGDADRERRREKRASQQRVYVDGDRVTDYGLRRSGSRRTEPIPIPKVHRSSTMPVEDGYYSEPRRERSRPIVVENGDRSRRSSSQRRESSAVPLGPYDVLYNYGAGSSRRDREKHARDSYLEPSRSHRRHSKSPVEVYTDPEQHDRGERRRLRRAKPTIVDGPAMTGVSADVIYGSSPFAGSYGSSYGSHPSDDHWTRQPTFGTQTPPDSRAPAVKGVRWDDDPRAAQNAKINSRPKLSRSATITGAGTGSHLHGEVKGILKNTNPTTYGTAAVANSGSAPAVQPLRREELDDLYKSVRGIGVDERETSAQRQARREKEERDDREYRDRLMNRFSPRDRRSSFDMPPRRFTSEKGSRGGRRSEVFYPDEGRYKYTPGY
ncbi:hypothetical protein N8I77_007809 [Diaporthe amygdali]|uniref:Uncharacterized protein n=1 Tax=Phomopsis amygdali TaxID=1214568 RepID=A0AAD9SE14_PHOAM|nr:hypothetical protein N8I77_007809 [Diaporthe amygdali]